MFLKAQNGQDFATYVNEQPVFQSEYGKYTSLLKVKIYDCIGNYLKDGEIHFAERDVISYKWDF